MANLLKIFWIQLEGDYLQKFDDLHMRSNLLIDGYLSEQELLIELLKLGIAQYEDTLTNIETEEFVVC
jgi:hypothetical protein